MVLILQIEDIKDLESNVQKMHDKSKYDSRRYLQYLCHSETHSVVDFLEGSLKLCFFEEIWFLNGEYLHAVNQIVTADQRNELRSAGLM